MVRTRHEDTLQNDGEYSEPFSVTNGVKKGCVMATTLFSMMFSAMLPYAFRTVMLVSLSGAALMEKYST